MPWPSLLPENDANDTIHIAVLGLLPNPPVPIPHLVSSYNLHEQLPPTRHTTPLMNLNRDLGRIRFMSQEITSVRVVMMMAISFGNALVNIVGMDENTPQSLKALHAWNLHTLSIATTTTPLRSR